MVALSHCSLLVRREIGVVLFAAAPEGRVDIRREREVVLQTVRQIGIRREVPAESHEVRIARGDHRFGAGTVEPAGGDDRP